MPSLILIKSPGGLTSGQAFPLIADVSVLGREAGCEITIPNNAVSRQHAKILRSGDKFVLEDLKSRNKTFLNNQEVGVPITLKNDDRIKICDFLFRFYDEKAAALKAPLPLPNNKVAVQVDDDDDDDEEDGDTTMLAKQPVAGKAAQQLLDTQPAERLRALLDISTSLSKTLELGPLLPQIADSLFTVFRQADRCFIIQKDENDRLIPRAVKSRRPGKDDERFSRTIVRKCMESGEAYLNEDASTDAALGAAMSIAAMQIRSAMCVPLLATNGKPLGVIQLDTHDFTKKFKKDDLELLTIVANFAAVAVEKATVHAALMDQQKQQQEIEIARKVQLGFLPQSCPEIEGYEFFAFYSAAQTVGGDYYDFIPLPGGRIATVLGDVAGKGVPASLLMAKLSAEARYCLLTQTDAAMAVRLLNDQLIRGGIGDRFVTLAAVILDPVAHTVTIVNAGHINPQRFRSHLAEFDEPVGDADSGVPLGLVQGFEYESRTIPMEPGEAFMLFTDGVTDAMSPAGEMFGFEGIKLSMVDDSVTADHAPRAVGDRLVKGVRKHASGRAQNDDIAVVCFGRVEHSGQLTGTSLAAPRVFESASGLIRADGSSLIRSQPGVGQGLPRPSGG